ncbi:MAG: UDP-N-acetylglucosamine 2-epimerase (non-hydrolyzing) [Planctomycetaceae bacterium]|nr:UDP-N-acetylglucosamine 2-epimerase (non-hydrolyzing) [Planctomycetaceae bacterium]
MSTRSLIVLGTRPEAIKLAPVIQQAQRHALIEPLVCSTGQHREMLAQVLGYFGIQPDLNLDVMRPNQTLAGLTSRLIEHLNSVVSSTTPDCIVAQGDTTTVMTAAMVAFYNRLPFVHVEAGLRTGNMNAPWPEEYNRRIAGLTASLHCAPTESSADNLRREGVPESQIHVTGNTVIDSLLWTSARERENASVWNEKYEFLGDARLVLITGHRRENFGAGFRSVLNGLADLAQRFPETQFLYPVHLNPNVQKPVHEMLEGIPNIRLTAPASYPEFIWLMDRSTLIITDSGGVQEEAPSLGKPVLVTREVTERPEAVETGAVELIGTSYERLMSQATLLLTDERAYAARQITQNPYGDGHAAERTVRLIAEQHWGAAATQRKAA